jgi:3-hydroxybutyrate dehydrogenase
MGLHGKVALVTGSTSGIGAGVAAALAAEGAGIVLNGFGSAEEVGLLEAALRDRFGVRTLYCGADVSRPGEVRAMVAQAEAALGSVDILVNNAGVQFTAPIEEFPEERWDQIIAINLSAAFHAMKAASPGMRARGWGRIINIASAHGLVASAEKAGYVAAKHGLVGLTKVGAIELANSGVTCNAICPGWVLTPLVQKQLDARAEREGAPMAAVERELLGEKQPMMAFTRPEQIGALAVFLCSEAAATMTGAPVSIDGGWTAQ